MVIGVAAELNKPRGGVDGRQQDTAIEG